MTTTETQGHEADETWDEWIASSTVNLNGKHAPLRDHA